MPTLPQHEYATHTNCDITLHYKPMERSIDIDTIGPLLESHSGYKHILVLIDCFTRWVPLYPLTDLTVRSTATTQLFWHFTWVPLHVTSLHVTQETSQVECDNMLTTQAALRHTTAHQRWLASRALRDNSEAQKYILALNDKSFFPLIPEKFHKEYGIQRAVRAARVSAEPLHTTLHQLQDNATLTAITRQSQSARKRTRR